MTSRKVKLLVLDSLVYLVAVISFSTCNAGATRCLFTHKDPHCGVIGNLPLQLNCSYPGKWFTIESVSKKNDAGGWQDVPAAVAVTEHVCKATRVQGVAQGGGSYCIIHGNITEITPDDEIKVEYFCWEIDPDLLGGFGKRSRIQLRARILHRARGV